MKAKYAVWVAFFLNLTYAIVEFIAVEYLVLALFLLTLCMTWEMRLQLEYQLF